MENKNSGYTLEWTVSKNGHYTICGPCFHSYPCRHRVINNITGETKTMSGTKIYRLFTEENIPIPSHFKSYAELVRQEDETIVVR